MAAQWTAVCTNSKCLALPIVLQTSERHVAPFDDEPVLNTRLSFAAITSAVNFTRVNDVLRTVGLGCLSSRGHWKVKEELEAPAAHLAQASMAKAYEHELSRPPSRLPRVANIDCFWDHSRQGKRGVVPFMSETGHIMHMETTSTSEKGIKSSNELERRSFEKGLKNPRMASASIKEIAMDGAKNLILLTEKALKKVAGDLWHFGKNRAKGFRAHCLVFVTRSKPTAVEREAEKAKKLTKPKVCVLLLFSLPLSSDSHCFESHL